MILRVIRLPSRLGALRVVGVTAAVATILSAKLPRPNTPDDNPRLVRSLELEKLEVKPPTPPPPPPPDPKPAAAASRQNSPKPKPRRPAPRTPVPPRHAMIQGGTAGQAEGGAEGPAISLHLPRDADSLRRFADAHGAVFVVSRPAGAGRAEVLKYLEWRGTSLEPTADTPRARGDLPRLLTDPTQLAQVGDPARRVSGAGAGDGLLTQILIDGAELESAAAAALRDAGYSGATRGDLLRAASGVAVACHGRTDGRLVCSASR